MHHAKTTIALAALLTLAACGGNGPDRADPADADATAVAELTPAEAAALLPDAIVGEGGTLRGQAVHYFESDAATAGYLAVPRGAGTFPAVILIHEWNGLVDRVRHFADDLAEQGYIVLAADLYSGRTGATQEENRALMEEVQADPQRIIDNLDAAASYLRARPNASGRVATIGWCFGGGVALSYAIGGENHDGTAMFYGRLVTDPAQLRQVTHPIYGTFAAKDQGIPPHEVAAFVDALRAVGVANDVHVYDDVDHGFWLWVDQDPDVRARPALDAWRLLLRYLDRTLES
ncbi:MAG TPA: dienelactone hydrolase family protein [Longimicrobiales bacterium]|nr:dienelactone hydrolase family protein [Longimicrobiales bacterium]